MKKTLFILTIFFSIVCVGQQPVKDLSDRVDCNYILANIYKTLYSSHSLYKDSFYMKAFLMSDSKSTPENYFDGTDEVLTSLLIVVKPDGDYYSSSKLYKIEMLLSPKIIEVKETTHPEFIVAVETGPKAKRTVNRYTLRAE